MARVEVEVLRSERGDFARPRAGASPQLEQHRRVRIELACRRDDGPQLVGLKRIGAGTRLASADAPLDVGHRRRRDHLLSDSALQHEAEDGHDRSDRGVAQAFPNEADAAAGLEVDDEVLDHGRTDLAEGACAEVRDQVVADGRRVDGVRAWPAAAGRVPLEPRLRERAEGRHRHDGWRRRRRLKHAQVDLGELQPDLRRKELGFFLWPDTLGLAATAIVYEDPPGADTVCR